MYYWSLSWGKQHSILVSDEVLWKSESVQLSGSGSTWVLGYNRRKLLQQQLIKMILRKRLVFLFVPCTFSVAPFRWRGEQSDGSQRACLPFGNALYRSLVHTSVSGGRGCSCFENNAACVRLKKKLINCQHLCCRNGISMYFWFCSRF